MGTERIGIRTEEIGPDAKLRCLGQVERKTGRCSDENLGVYEHQKIGRQKPKWSYVIKN